MAIIYKHLDTLRVLLDCIDQYLCAPSADILVLNGNESVKTNTAEAPAVGDVTHRAMCLYRVGGAKRMPPGLYAMFAVDSSQVKLPKSVVVPNQHECDVAKLLPGILGQGSRQRND